MAQHILAARSDRLPYDWSANGAGGCFPGGEAALFKLLDEAGLWIGPRPALELDPSFRQIIPYVVLVDRVPSDPDARFLSYCRTAKGEEARLHGKFSIGFGGHVDIGDLVITGDSIHLRFTLERAAEREMAEEVGAEINPMHRQWLCALADNGNEVGKVHLGLVWLWMVSPDYMPTVKEDPIGDIRFMDRKELIQLQLEPWTGMLLYAGVLT